MRRILQRLKTEQGFSLTEQLATILIMGFVGIMVTTGAATVQKVYRKVIAHANAQSALTTTAGLLRDQLAFADPETVQVHSDGTISFKNLNSGDQIITIYPGNMTDTPTEAVPEGGSTEKEVKKDSDKRGFYLVYAVTDASGTTTTETPVPLLSDSAITTDLCVGFDTDGGFEWNEDSNTLTVKKLMVRDLKTDSIQAGTDFTIRLLNQG